MSSLSRAMAYVPVVLMALALLGGCDTNKKPQTGDECVTTFDCPDGLVCEDGYCVEGSGDQITVGDGDGVKTDDGTALPEYDPGVFPDDTEEVQPEEEATDDGAVEFEADESAVDDMIEIVDDGADVTDDAAELIDNSTEVTDDAIEVADDMIEVTDDATVVTDDAAEPVDDTPVPDEDVVIVDDQPVVDVDTVDVTPPTVTTTSPLDAAVNVAPDTLVTVTFSEALDPATVDALTFVLVENGGGAVDAPVTYDDKDFTVTLDPTALLNYGASYTVTVMTAITDLAGNPLATEYVFSFTMTTCGNGTPDGSEICDDGAQNGTYDHCNIFCMGQGSHCGDGVIDLPQELCDNTTTIACDQIAGESYANTTQVPCNGACDGWTTTSCTCAAGYTKDGNEDCVDIDECTVNTNPCDNNGDTAGACTNTTGSYTCTCSSGFQPLGGGCRNINECLTLSNPCDNNGDTNALCSDLTPGYVCNCSGGFEPVNGACTDIDDCVGTPCDDGGDTGASCNNLSGSFTCSCSFGWYDTGATCEEKDECEGNPCNDNGDAGGQCTDQVGTYLCGCSIGFEFTDGGCMDINECTTLTNPCDDQGDSGATCNNDDGGYSCSCTPAFSEGAGTCQDINECLVGNGGCDTDPLTECTNTTGGRTCADCPAGYTGNGADADGCVNIDECVTLTNPCDNGGDGGATCADNNGGYTCNCSGGWYDNGTTCVEIDDCYNNPCDNNGDGGAACTDIGVGYTCSCSSGWQSNGTVCVDINECTLTNPCNDQGDNSAVCTNSDGGYSCACSTGFTVGSGTCIDNDECVAQNNPCNDNGDTPATCANTPGTYTCGCSSGFTASGGSCHNINECLSGNGGCDALTTCTDTIGGRLCGACPSGYSGDGYTGCTDIDECVVNSNPCNDNGNGAATCNNTAGSYTCTCSSGFSFSSGSCRDLDECTLNTDNCHALASCTNTVGGFTCACIPPSTGNGVTCTTCGDGTVDAGESCDSGLNNGSYGYCNSICTGLGPRCGDGTTNGPEQCDDANSSNNDNCKNNCTNNVCGDGYQNTAGAFTETFGSTMPSYSSGTWSITSAAYYSASYSMRSAAIGNSASSSVTMSRYTDGTICFWVSGSSEESYDYLRVYIDGSEKWSTTGSLYEGYWGQVCLTTTAGTRSLVFTYSKDSSSTYGDDAYFIDNIRFSGAAEECESGQTSGCSDCGTVTCTSCHWNTSGCYDSDQWGDC